MIPGYIERPLRGNKGFPLFHLTFIKPRELSLKRCQSRTLGRNGPGFGRWRQSFWSKRCGILLSWQLIRDVQNQDSTCCDVEKLQTERVNPLWLKLIESVNDRVCRRGVSMTDLALRLHCRRQDYSYATASNYFTETCLSSPSLCRITTGAASPVVNCVLTMTMTNEKYANLTADFGQSLSHAVDILGECNFSSTGVALTGSTWNAQRKKLVDILTNFG